MNSQIGAVSEAGNTMQSVDHLLICLETEARLRMVEHRHRGLRR